MLILLRLRVTEEHTSHEGMKLTGALCDLKAAWE